MTKMAFFGNSVGWEVFALDLTADPMRVERVVRTSLGPYPVDEAAADTLFAITRGSPSVTAIDITTLTPLGDIPLAHKPRSASRHPTRGLVLVSGADRPRTSVVDVVARRVRLTVGIDHGGTVSGFGGSLASGHERWLPDLSAVAAPRFFVLDRVNRTVAVFQYDPPTGTKLFEAPTPSPVHHLLADEPSRTWYALCEGRPADGVPPAVLPIRETAADTFEVGTAFELPVPKGSVAASGGHHLDAKGGRLFAGSNEGNLYVFDKTPLGANPVVLPTGPGCGHTRFTRFDGRDVAVTVNHTAPHVSLVDVSTPGREVKLADIPVSVALPAGPDDKTQGHTTAVFADSPHLVYVMASLDATLREVDLRARLVRRSVRLVQPAGSIPPLPLQGHFGEYARS